MRPSRPRRYTRLRRRNPARYRERRKAAFGPQAELCRGLPCAVPSCTSRPPSDPAHVRSRGAGGLDKGNVIPLCRRHHVEQHSVGIRTFESRYGLDLEAYAKELAKRAYRS